MDNGASGLEAKVIMAKRSGAANTSDTVSEIIFYNAPHGLSELCTNSHDADAENWRCTYDPQNDSIVIEDDGKGMDEAGVLAFFRMGDSPKAEEPITKKGRKKLGKFGIASLAVKYLANNHHFETWRDGVKYEVTEDFTQRRPDHEEFPIHQVPCDEEGSGTRITLTGLREVVADTLDVKAFRDRLGDEMPVLEDFTMTVNGVVVKPYQIRSATEYVIDLKRHPLLGRVYGSFYVTNGSFGDRAGIFVKINNRSVIGDDLELDRRLKLGLKKRVRAIVHADSLDGKIKLTRAGIKRSDEMATLRRCIDDVLLQIGRDNDRDKRSEALMKAQERFDDDCAKVAESFMDVLGYLPRIEFSTDTANATGGIGRFFPSEKRIVIYSRGEGAKIRKLSPKGIADTLYRTCAATITLGSVPESQRDQVAKVYHALFQQENKGTKGRAVYLSDLVRKVGESRRVDSISHNRLFTITEFSRLTGQPNAVLKRMKSAGVITPYKEDLYLGETVVAIENEYNSLFSLFEVSKDIDIPPGREQPATIRFYREKEANERLTALEEQDQLPPWIENRAKKGMDPFYVVHEADYEKMLNYLNTWELEAA